MDLATDPHNGRTDREVSFAVSGIAGENPRKIDSRFSTAHGW